MTVVLISAIGFFIQQDVIYSFFGLSTEVQQLHMPASVDATLANLGQQPDYFFSLLELVWLVDFKTVGVIYWCIRSSSSTEENSFFLRSLSVLCLEVCRLGCLRFILLGQRIELCSA